jgi:DHA1 family multidrug resistance protein-like MFS transporter
LATALQIPALTSLTSKRATMPQGMVMGLSNSFVSLGRIFGPLLGGTIFDINILLPYLSGAAILGIGFIVSLTSLKRVEAEPAIAEQPSPPGLNPVGWGRRG